MRVCNGCLKSDDEVPFARRSNICIRCNSDYNKELKERILERLPDKKARMFEDTKKLVANGATEQEVIKSIEDGVFQVEKEYESRYNAKSNGVIPNYDFKVIPRTAQEAMIIIEREEITEQDLINDFTERQICGYGV